MTIPTPLPPGRVYLIGVGIVGRAILKAHIDARVSCWILDQSSEAIQHAVDSIQLDTHWQFGTNITLPDGTTGLELIHNDLRQPRDVSIVIESIVERLDVKRSFFANAHDWFGGEAILCSNTSNLRITEIAEAVQDASRFAGMHFFMPVDRRPATEVVRGELTSQTTIEACCDHAEHIGKPPLVVADGPGFIVNRMLSPYLNESLLLLCRGTPAEQLERAAEIYGMPMSPLELIDYIGVRTMFDAGRAFWQSFPDRLSPSPMLAGLIKKKRLGRADGRGLYDYAKDHRSADLAPETKQICETYRRHEQSLHDSDVVELLSIPMWIESALAKRDGIAKRIEDFNFAMRGGLGFTADRPWIDFFDEMGSERITSAVDRWSDITAAMKAPAELLHALEGQDPSQAWREFE